MKKILTQYVVCALAVALMGPLAQAQPAGIQAAFGKDAGTLSEEIHRTRARYVGQVRLEARPGRSLRRRRVQPDRCGVPRARRRAFGHTEYAAKPAPITDPEKLQEALKASYVDLQKAITGLSDNDLQAPVKLFGRDMTKQGALMLILEDQHEHPVAVDRVRAQQRRRSALV